VILHGNVPGNGGKVTNEEPPYGLFHNSSSYYNLFDAYEDIIIDNVKVYANGAEDRTIQVVNESGEVIAETTVLIPDGESVVTLNFFVPAGENYGLRCAGNDPQLWRDKNVDESAPFDFPYDLDGLGAITNTTVAGGDTDNYYYFFYDWNVHTPEFACPSPRTEGTVTIVGIEELEVATNISLFPNPAESTVNLSFDMLTGDDVKVTLYNSLGQPVRIIQYNDVTVGNNQRQIDVQELSAGLYQVNFEVNNKSVSRTLAIN
jgi:hypothetical protein